MNKKTIMNSNYSHCEIHPFLILRMINIGVQLSNQLFHFRIIINHQEIHINQLWVNKQLVYVLQSYFLLVWIQLVIFYIIQKKPLVTTRSMKYLNTSNMPSGINAIICKNCNLYRI